MNWILSICIGATWAGCGSWRHPEYPSEESCYRALAAMKATEQALVEGSSSKRNNVAYCGPKQSKSKETK